MLALFALLPLLLTSTNAYLVPRRQPNARASNKHDQLRPLEWGDLNFLHTTDTHGWLAGHMLERQFSGDWGDFVSFTTRMRALADEKNKDLIIVDTGDRHDGNGLSDATEVNGELSQPVFCEVDYDVVTVGNHELYTGLASLQEFHSIRHHFQEKYVVSNVELFDDNEWKPLGSKYYVFQTRNLNKTVLAFGFLFNFEGNDKELTNVTRVEDEIKKEWFQNVLKNVVPKVDYIVLAGHIPVRGWPEFHTILNAIRSVNKTIPVSMFGGHSHVRDYVVYDDYAVALQSGRYVETIGFASVNLTNTVPEFKRAYIDFNQRTMAYHANVSSIDELATPKGLNLSKHLTDVRKSLDLDEQRTTIPRTYYMDRTPYPSEQSVYTLFENELLPLLTSPKELIESGQSRFVYLNTGALRFDMFRGPFTKDSTYILSPFKNKWVYIDDVPLHIAEQILPILNGHSKVLQANSRFTGALYMSELESAELDDLRNGDSDSDSDSSSSSSNSISVSSSEAADGKEEGSVVTKKPSFGYVTYDDIGSGGDDTVHRAWQFYDVPNVIVSIDNKYTENVTLVYTNFMQWYIDQALALLTPVKYEPKPHGGEDITDLVPKYFEHSQS